MSKKYSTTEKCIFCGKEAGSEEHVFPNWLRKEFKGHGTLEYQGDMNSPVLCTRVTDLRLTVRSVCQYCNVGWMSRLQEGAKPLIKSLLSNSSVSFDACECKLLTSWAVMTAMCSETRNPPGVWRFTDQERTVFYSYENRPIPIQTHVWVCRWEGSPGPFVVARLLEMRGEGAGDRAYAMTIGFGTLIIQVLRVKPVDPNDQRSTMPRGSLPWDEIVTQIWNLESLPIRFPKRRAIQGENEFDLLAERFKIAS